MTIDLETARRLALEEAHRDYYKPNGLALLDDMTITKPYGWVFFYDSKRHIETGNPLHMLGGNGPIVVEKDSGRVTPLGSARAPETEIATFEQENGFSTGST